MAYLPLRKKIEEIDGIEDLNKALTIILEIFFLDKIEVFQKKKESISTIEKKIFNSESFIIEAVRDPFFNFTEELISLSNLVIFHYTNFLNKYLENNKSGFKFKIKALNDSFYLLNNVAQKHYLNNRFAFAARSVFELKHTKGFMKVNIENLKLSEEQRKIMNEWFTIRYELFTELANTTNNKIEQLEYERFKYSAVKMNQEEGPKLLMELIMALTINKTFVDIKRSDKEIFEDSLFEFFGVELIDSSNLRINIAKRKKNKAVALQELVDSLNSSETYTKKIRKTNKTGS